jgi:uncharacterized iron-regulated protein
MRTYLVTKLICLATFVGLTFVFDIANANEAPPWEAWQARLHQNHPLVGKIWSRRKDDFVTDAELIRAAREARFLLLGEIHDNPDAHRLQAWMIKKVADGRKPAIVLEMVPRDYAKRLESYIKKPKADPAGLGAVLDWEKRGWPDWKFYEPIVSTAMAHSLRLYAGDIEKPILKKVGQKGLRTLDDGTLNDLYLTTPLSKALADSLLEELYESHCQLMSKAALGNLSEVQRLRDAVLADSLLKAAGNGSAILIAGNGHVRTDRAVPWFLERRKTQAVILTLMLIEVEAESVLPEDLVPTAPNGKPVADYVWFIPRQERENPCSRLRKYFGKR